MTKRTPPIRIELVWSRWPGYGGPAGCRVQGVYKNKVLFEQSSRGSKYDEQLAVWADRQVRKFQDAAKSSAFEAMLARKKQAFPLCSHCGEPARASVSCLNKTWCENKKECQAALEAAKVAYDEKVARDRTDSDRRMVEGQRQRNAAALDAVASAFHWRDSWFFRRQNDGSVRVMRLRKATYDHLPEGAKESIWLEPDVTIPPNEWASIVASVSDRGESDGRWQEALDFHGDQPLRSAGGE